MNDDKQAACRGDIRRLENKICKLQDRMETVMFGADGTKGMVENLHKINFDIYGTPNGHKGIISKIDESRERIKAMETDVTRAKTAGGVLIGVASLVTLVATKWKDIKALIFGPS
jgi:predicted translin family RNA/ssDNA-binding protein